MAGSARTRLALSVGRMAFVLSLIMTGALTWYLQHTIQGTRSEAMRARVRALASGAACLIDPAEHDYLSAQDGGAVPESLSARLRWFQTQNGLAGVYTVAISSDGNVKTVVGEGAFGGGTWNGSQSLKALKAAVGSGMTVVDEIRSDKSGVYLSAYSPIRSGTKTSGALVIHYRTTWPSVFTKAHLILVGSIITLSLVMGWLVAVMLGKWLIAPVEGLARQARLAATGDLRESAMEIQGYREFETLKESFAGMLASLRRLVGHLGESARHLGAWSQSLREMAHSANRGTGDVARMMQEMASGADQTAHSTATIADELVRLDAVVSTIARVAAETVEMASRTSLEADRGTGLVESAATEADGAVAALQNSMGNTAVFSEWSGEIGRAAGSITSLAEQINLLAMNARIEAARAGEGGRGFAVVAEKVAALAEETSSIAEHISGINARVGDQIHAVNTTIGETARVVTTLSGAMTAANGTFSQILQGVHGISSQMTQIETSLDNLREETTRIRAVTDGVASVAEESAAGTEEVGAAMEEQAALIAELETAIGRMHELAEKLGGAFNAFQL